MQNNMLAIWRDFFTMNTLRNNMISGRLDNTCGHCPNAQYSTLNILADRDKLYFEGADDD